MRFAFIAPEFPTTLPNCGGIGTHVRRMAQLLTSAGHPVEVFVATSGRGDSLEHEGYLVHHVRIPPGLTTADKGLRTAGLARLSARRVLERDAALVARAVERVHQARPFDIVQSPDHRGLGLRLESRQGWFHVVRCSSVVRHYLESDGRDDAAGREQSRIEEETVRRAGLVLSPSRLTAEHYGRQLGRDVVVVRPPAFLEVPDPGPPPDWLAGRYFMHFAASFTPRKGSDLVAEATALALREIPDLRVVWVGRPGPSLPEATHALLRATERQAIRLHPQGKDSLYALLRGAVAAVLPSRVDNVPNAAIESLLLGVPVIAACESSLEEMIEDGVSGCLVANGSAEELAAAMSRAWRGEMARVSSWLETPLGRPFRPEAALAAYLAAIEGALSARQPNGTTV